MKWLRLMLALTIVSIAAVSSSVLAQDVADVITRGETRNVLTLGTSMDPAITFDLGYTRHIPLGLGEHARNLTISTQWSAIPGFGSWDAELSATMRARDQVGLDVLLRTSLTLKRVVNAVHEGFTYGFETGIYPGYYSDNWYVASQLAVRQAFAMSISHTDAYRAIYPEVEDGTYLLGGFNTFVGVGAGTQIFGQGLVGLSIAWRSQNLFEAYTPFYMPYTVSLQTGYRF